MTHTVFVTPGELDLSALTTFGMNVKPGVVSPIGFFGTGLKYAIAVLLRHGIEVTLYTGGSEYKFYTKDKEFRGKDFKTCRYRKTGLLNKFTYHELPFTTELGKHWELWHAFRELMSNTIDENGSLITSEHFLEELGVVDQIPKYTDFKQTWIVIEGQAFADVVAKKDEIFLPKDKLKLVAANSDVEVYEGQSRYIYYRGLRAYDLKDREKQTLYTCNYIGSGAELTEDRTIKYLFYVQWAIQELVSRSEDRKFIGTMMKPKDMFWEKDLDYSSTYSKSDTFNSVVYRMGSSSAAQSFMPSTARTYYSDVLQPQRNPVYKVPEVSNEAWDLILETIDNLSKEALDMRHKVILEDVRAALQDAFDRKPPALEVVMVPKDDIGDDIPF